MTQNLKSLDELEHNLSQLLGFANQLDQKQLSRFTPITGPIKKTRPFPITPQKQLSSKQRQHFDQSIELLEGLRLEAFLLQEQFEEELEASRQYQEMLKADLKEDESQSESPVHSANLKVESLENHRALLNEEVLDDSISLSFDPSIDLPLDDPSLDDVSFDASISIPSAEAEEYFDQSMDYDQSLEDVYLTELTLLNQNLDLVYDEDEDPSLDEVDLQPEVVRDLPEHILKEEEQDVASVQRIPIDWGFTRQMLMGLLPPVHRDREEFPFMGVLPTSPLINDPRPWVQINEVDWTGIPWKEIQVQLRDVDRISLVPQAVLEDLNEPYQKQIALRLQATNDPWSLEDDFNLTDFDDPDLSDMEDSYQRLERMLDRVEPEMSEFNLHLRDQQNVETAPNLSESLAPSVLAGSKASSAEDPIQDVERVVSKVDLKSGLNLAQIRDLEQINFDQEAPELNWGDETPTPMFTDEFTPTPIWSGRRHPDTEEAGPPSMTPLPFDHQRDTEQIESMEQLDNDNPNTSGRSLLSKLFGKRTK